MPIQTSSTEPSVSVAAHSHPVPLGTVSHGPQSLSRFNDRLSRIEAALERLHTARTADENGSAAGSSAPEYVPADKRVSPPAALGGLPPTLDRIEAKIDAILKESDVSEPGRSAPDDQRVSMRQAIRSAARAASSMADAASFEIEDEPKGKPKTRRRTRRLPGIVVLAIALTPLSLALHIAVWIALY